MTDETLYNNELNDNFDTAENKPIEKESQHAQIAETKLSGLYKDWWINYASYVILERAVPHLDDGLKPVQRRILHAMKRMDDGRYNKVANIIGYTMQYHPHGDASIGEALVQLGQKDLLIDTQGNWGNILTGDSAAAPRYIEARLSKFANTILFNHKLTEWKSSYDGRNQEPVTLPVKFPLLLAQGVEGIAVGLASKILPHNFNELIDASIAYLKGEDFELYPDFPTGGYADVSRYNDGLRGGIIKVRAKIKKLDSKTLVINDLPYGITTDKLIESIIKANDKGKIKIKKIDDNTSDNVEIILQLAPGVSPDVTIDALYAFTACEISISPNACVISNGKPLFLGVKDILKASTDRTLQLLKKELQIQLSELQDEWHFSSLEKIFIENKIYRLIEECETWDSVVETVYKALLPYENKLLKPITNDDVLKLLELHIKRISKYNTFEADKHIKDIETNIDEVNNHLSNIVAYTIQYFRNIKKAFGKGKERKTELRSFENIEVTRVAIANAKLYVNREEGFIGIGLKKDEFVCECSDIDDIIAFTADGNYIITKVSDKAFIGKNIIYVNVFQKNDKQTTYHILYRDGKFGPVYLKRFQITGITRDKVYNATQGTEGSKILWFSANKSNETEIIRIILKPKPKLKKLVFDVNFADYAIKGRNAQGNIITRHEIHKIQLKDKQISQNTGIHLYFDEQVKRLNTNEIGIDLGIFNTNDRILILTQSGHYRTYIPDINVHFEDDMVFIEKYNPTRIFTIIYYDGESGFHYIKRFKPEITDKLICIISNHPKSKMVQFNTDYYPRLNLTYGGKHKNRPDEIIDVESFIGVKNDKAIGKRLTPYEISKLTWLEPIKKFEPTPIVQDIKQEELFELPGISAPTDIIDEDQIEQMKLDL
ncbi:MAG: DNA gyrase/topoisomerase IV subunit A [Bacteroidales bacterium]|nr:DNA gyrase/topoisomerase IV subunit A [Bacteroidales bacterium]